MRLKLMLMPFAMAKMLLIGGIMEHIEQAGVHSGDSSCTLPPFSLSVVVQEAISIESNATNGFGIGRGGFGECTICNSGVMIFMF